jgi:hypothetical protein
LCRLVAKGPPPGALGEGVNRAQDFRCAPSAVAGAVGELDDHASLNKGVDVSAGVAGGDAGFTLQSQCVEDGPGATVVGGPPGEPVLLAFAHGRLFAVVVLTIRAGKVLKIEATADPSARQP